MEVNKRITALREQQGYSVNKLANLAGISQGFLRDIELGNKRPTVETLSYICDALQISLRDFFDDGNSIEDELMQEIYRLNQSQRYALLQFLKAL